MLQGYLYTASSLKQQDSEILHPATQGADLSDINTKASPLFAQTGCAVCGLTLAVCTGDGSHPIRVCSVVAKLDVFLRV